MGNKHPHLQFIQDVVSRMARHSFVLKGWSLTLIVALFALATKDVQVGFVSISLISVLMFWLLDSYYLHQEKMFRSLYDEVREKEDNRIDYSMHVSHLNTGENIWRKSFFSKTLFIFYVPLITLILIVLIINYLK